jgi:hypothetical protein
MSESPGLTENVSEDEAGTIVLVDVNDIAIGSMSLVERLSVDDDAERLIHRTCSLHVFWNRKEMGSDKSSSYLLMSRFPTVDSNLALCNGNSNGTNVSARVLSC